MRVAGAMIARMERDGGRDNWNQIALASIDEEAINYARLEWVKYYGPDTHQGFIHSWERLHHKFAHRPAHFDLAIWQIIGGTRILQGLALGKPSNGKTHLTINWVERSFAPTYLKGGILLPILACAEEYARLLGCVRVLLKDPVDPKIYHRYGYEVYHPPRRVQGAYLCKGLDNGNEVKS
jgi:hypothetical protein